MYDASSEARNKTAFATSSVSPARTSSTPSSTFARTAGSAVIPDVRIGGISPGCTELARIPLEPNCTAMDFVNVRTAPLEALEPMCVLSEPVTPAMEDKLTIDPPPACFIASTACLVPRNTPREFTAISLSQASLSSMSETALPLMPVVHQDVELAVFLHRRLDHGLPVGLVGDIKTHELGGAVGA